MSSQHPDVPSVARSTGSDEARLHALGAVIASYEAEQGEITDAEVRAAQQTMHERAVTSS